MDLFQSARAQELSELISRYQDSYYNGEAEISDAEFDSLWDELKSIDPTNPLLHRVGADSGNFLKATHLIPMGSQEKAANPEEFLSWAEKHPYEEYFVEYKLDGASLELQYENGYLTKAVTRGNGTVGDDITINAKKMQGVLSELKINGELFPYTGGIRGEVIMTHEVHKNYFPDKANCRNAANGIMKRKDGKGSEHLKVICYDAFFTNYTFADEEVKLNWIKSCGFETVPLQICSSAQDVINYRSKVMEYRNALSYDIDGLVIKSRIIDMEDASRVRPDKQIAFKFSLEEAISVLRDVEWSESGATYTPVGLFDSVELAGTTVKRASLVNPNTIRALNIRIGSHIVVTKRGEIIPKIEAVVPREDSSDESDIVFPKVCSACGSNIMDEGTRLYCPNKDCSKRILHRIEKWINVLDIRDFGTALIKALFEAGKIRSVLDIYLLTENDLTPFFLNEESISKEKKSLGAEKVIKSISVHNNIRLETFIAGFDIEGIGETLMEKLTATGFDTFDKLIEATEEDISAVNGFGSITAKTLVQGLSENVEEMKQLLDKGFITIKLPLQSGSLSGKSFCFTGELSIKRAEAEKMVKEKGGMIKSSVVKGLSYLVTNDVTSGSSKNKKASQLGIPVIDEAAFMSLLNEN
ncbi:MAG: NAD-dependent DNA ligase LigA [Spirochaetaceae bacterium]|nr:NAD-dependent DNA ligase LigA [Spirochaetaceae bacterium]